MPGLLYADRDTALLDLCRGKNVLHIGCTDAPFTQKKLSDGLLLHVGILGAAAQAHGVDIDEEGIGLLRDLSSGTYSVVDVSVTEAVLENLTFTPNLILAGDVIEHVDDQSAFMKGVAHLARKFGQETQVVLSTPNALAFRSVINTAFGREIIHPDHRLLHTPSTIGGLFCDVGLSVRRIDFYNISSGPGFTRRMYDSVPRIMSHLRAPYADGLIVLASPK